MVVESDSKYFGKVDSILEGESISLLLEISGFSSSESNVIDELFCTLREGNWLDVEIGNRFVFASDD